MRGRLDAGGIRAVKPLAETLPLGIDIGRRRIRVALSARGGGGSAKLIAVAARDHDGDVAEALLASLDELRTPERRCVVALAAPDAVLATADLPPMSPWERLCAARFEAARFIDYPIGEAAVSLARTGSPQRWAIGVARRSTLAASLQAVKAARLRTIAVDDVAFALRRAQPDAGAILDVGEDATRIVLFGEDVPYVATVPIGGGRLTQAVATSLGVDAATAEERKRRIGFGGAGEAERDALIAAIAEAFGDARTHGYSVARDVVLCGNGSRIPGFGAAVERATGFATRAATLPPEISDTLPSDVLRAGAPDWSVAYGLSLWSIAG